jgi:hypothetical protein
MFKGTLIAIVSLSMAFSTYAAPVAAPVAMPVAVATPAVVAEPIVERNAMHPVAEIVERVSHQRCT